MALAENAWTKKVFHGGSSKKLPLKTFYPTGRISATPTCERELRDAQYSPYLHDSLHHLRSATANPYSRQHQVDLDLAKLRSTSYNADLHGREVLSPHSGVLVVQLKAKFSTSNAFGRQRILQHRHHSTRVDSFPRLCNLAVSLKTTRGGHRNQNKVHRTCSNRRRANTKNSSPVRSEPSLMPPTKVS